MSKEQLKKEIGNEHGYQCMGCGAEVTDEDIENGTIDTHRLLTKAEGFGYSIDTTRIVCPVCHMEEHGNLRIRPEELDDLKIAIDDREQWMKTTFKINNQVLAYKRRTDSFSEITAAELLEMIPALTDKIKARTKIIEKWIKDHKDVGLVKSLMNVPGLGPQTAAYLLVYLDPFKAKHRSSYWKYAGFHCAGKDRYQKGVAGGGNKTLRTALYRCATAMWKNKQNPYRLLGDQVKARLEESEKLVSSRNVKGQLVSIPWKDTMKCHRHGAATRRIMKEVIGDYWVVSRKFAGLPTDNPYVSDELGHVDIVDCRTRGWLYPEDVK